MSKPIVAVVGRPNVGKSTLVNRLAVKRDAIVHESRGVTRDRSYHDCDWNGREFVLIDTGGIESVKSKDTFAPRIREQALAACDEADVIVFVVDGTVGVTDEDEEVARVVRRTKKPVFLVVNKIDNPAEELENWAYYSLGVGEPRPLSAGHGHGTGDLLDEVVAALPPETTTRTSRTTMPSTWPSSDGPTWASRRSPTSSWARPLHRERRGGHHARRRRLADRVEGQPHPPGRHGRHAQEDPGPRGRRVLQHRARPHGHGQGRRLPAGGRRLGGRHRAGPEARGHGHRPRLRHRHRPQQVGPDRLRRGARTRRVLARAAHDLRHLGAHISISALTGRAACKVLDHAVVRPPPAPAASRPPSSTRFSTRFASRPHGDDKGNRRLKLNYATQTGHQPPTFTFFCNAPDLVDDNYQRYLENRLRETFDLVGTPIRLKFRRKED